MAETRPCSALSTHLMALYKRLYANRCVEMRRQSATRAPSYNNGFDDKDGHYVVIPGEEILQRYTVQEVIGKGSFGTVLKCYDERRRETVAMKITRNGFNFRNQAKIEIDVLLKLNSNPALSHLVVRLLKVFDWQSHLVLVFELLSYNLYQLVKCTKYSGVSLDLVRKFALQLMQVLHQLELYRPAILHCDIKPENILLRAQNRSGIRLIDFGSACYENRRVYKYIQSRFYRSPEVILHMEYGTAIDRWSLGCVLTELHTGTPLFDGRSEAAQLAKMERVLGAVPQDLLRQSAKASKYYDTVNGVLKLKEPPTAHTSLVEIIGVHTGGPKGSRLGQAGHDEESYVAFCDFISKLLQYSPKDRLSCTEAFSHPFLAPLVTSLQATPASARGNSDSRGGIM